jgi:hypothetical protein
MILPCSGCGLSTHGSGSGNRSRRPRALGDERHGLLCSAWLRPARDRRSRPRAVGGTAPTVLALAAPARWLSVTARRAGQDDTPPDSDRAETAAVYVADLLRIFAGAGVGGLLLDGGRSCARCGRSADPPDRSSRKDRASVRSPSASKAAGSAGPSAGRRTRQPDRRLPRTAGRSARPGRIGRGSARCWAPRCCDRHRREGLGLGRQLAAGLRGRRCAGRARARRR